MRRTARQKQLVTLVRVESLKTTLRFAARKKKCWQERSKSPGGLHGTEQFLDETPCRHINSTAMYCGLVIKVRVMNMESRPKFGHGWAGGSAVTE